MTRQRVGQRPPERSLEGFPRIPLDSVLYRCARRAPWWFCKDGDCRFDLIDDSPHGTLYAGTDAITGVLETLGDDLLGGVVSIDMLRDRTVWALRVDQALEVADLTHPSALGFGITNELSTMTPYATPQRWASALWSAGFGGIAYRTRYNPTSAATGRALFGPAGSQELPAQPVCGAGDATMIEALATFGISVAAPPHSHQLDVR